jgi:hypothetical protein
MLLIHSWRSDTAAVSLHGQIQDTVYVRQMDRWHKHKGPVIACSVNKIPIIYVQKGRSVLNLNVDVHTYEHSYIMLPRHHVHSWPDA